MSYTFTRFLQLFTGSVPQASKSFPIQNVKLLQLQGASSLLTGSSINLNGFLNGVMSRSQPARWFDNPYNDYQQNLGEPLDLERIRKFALEKAEQVFAKGTRDGDGGVYVGAVGCAYMYLHILEKLTPEEARRFLPHAINAFQIQSVYFNKNPGNRSDECGFLLGKAGHYAVGAVLGHVTKNEELMNNCLHRFVSAAEICKPLNFFSHGGDELFVGRAGYLCGALWLEQKLGYQPVPTKDLLDIWTAIVDSGKQYSKLHKSPCPLMYSYYETEYLGAAHGLSAILQILLSFPSFLVESPESANLIKNTVDYYLSLQGETGNFPCSMDEIQMRQSDDMLVHWCHGAPGAIYLFAKAFSVYKEQKYLEACIKCGDLMWDKGLLRKGPGICHGVSGNGYVFLIINQLLKGEKADGKHLYRAGKFAEFLEHPQFLKEARRPDSPFSLYEGWAGTVCFLMDVLQPDNAEFPFFSRSTFE